MITAGIVGGLLATGVRLAVPLQLAALGEMMAERSGVINVGIEGMVLGGALAGFLVSLLTHSAMLGVAAAAVAGALLAALFLVFTLKLAADQVVVGTALNILSLGLTGVFFRAFLTDTSASAPAFNLVPIPYLSKIPVIGDALFNQYGLGYAAWLLTPLCSWYLFRSLPGLRLRAAGEYPAAADASGVPVPRVRTLAVLWGGALAGIAGAYLSIGYTDGFIEKMSAGQGFIALAVVILGRWSPGGILAASLLFGMARALQFQLGAAQFSAIPYQVFQAVPYLLTLLALVMRPQNRFNGPAALGEAYTRA
jgi:simple sugar transport system permease protein